MSTQHSKNKIIHLLIIAKNLVLHILNEFCTEKRDLLIILSSEDSTTKWSSRKREHDLSGSIQNNVE